jgi:hypothetical protein
MLKFMKKRKYLEPPFTDGSLRVIPNGLILGLYNKYKKMNPAHRPKY